MWSENHTSLRDRANKKFSRMFKNMWNLGKSTSQGGTPGIRTKDSLTEELHNEVRSAAPGARLSYGLRTSLERLEKSERREVVSVVGKSGCSPLFTACKKGNLEIVEYLLETCDADVEQKGIYEVVDDKTSHCVSPLWCAAVCGRLPIVKYLVKHGADVNSMSDSGSTPVRSACFMTHFEIVQYLVEHGGADISIPNFNGGTALINSVQSAPLCAYLVEHGANVNAQDIQLKTALHYAIQEHRFETTKLLLAHGADPFIKNRYGDDALQTSCLKGATGIFKYLLDLIPDYSRERRAEMHELMGATFLDEHHDIQMALYFWRKAISIRYGSTPHLPKKALGYSPIYSQFVDFEGNIINVTEFQTGEELEAIATDLDHIRINSLLIAERILGSIHKDVLFRIMYRGAAYADSSQYLSCIRLWKYALQLRISKDSLLYGDTCFTALALIRLFLDLDRNSDMNRNSPAHPLQLTDLLGTFILLVEHLPQCAKSVRIRPVYKRQQESYDRCLRCCTHLLFLLLRAPGKTAEQFLELRKATQSLLRSNLRMCSTGDTLLHMAVSRNNIVRSHFFVDDHQVHVFPSYEVVSFLISCGANVNAVNDNRALPLHLIVAQDDFNSDIVKLLLAHGSHIDQLDKSNHNPLKILQGKPNILPSRHIVLKCIAAEAVCKYKIPYSNLDLPRELSEFVDLHRPNDIIPDVGRSPSPRSKRSHR